MKQGAESLADFSKRMIDYVGEKYRDDIEPHLKDLYERAMGTAVHHSELQPRTEEGKFDGEPVGYTPKDERLPETTGIARRVEEARRGPVPDSGGGIGAQESVEHGREMLRAGRDPQGVVDDFEKTGAVSADAMALVRAKHEELARTANQASDKGGINSPEFKAAEKHVKTSGKALSDQCRWRGPTRAERNRVRRQSTLARSTASTARSNRRQAAR